MTGLVQTPGQRSELPAPTSLVLVAVMPSPRDLEIARLLGWYRIPFISAPKVVAVDYLAFYQPAAFGTRKWRVEWLAPVQGYELVRRAELLAEEVDHPRALEEYFRIQLGGLIRLPSPILAGGWKRITFLYTTGAYLLQATTVKELVIKSDERALLWRSLRERAIQAPAYRTADLPEPELPPEVLAAVLGIPVSNHPQARDPVPKK